jgi:poly(3-hydroxybutyrate) depolymerase
MPDSIMTLFPQAETYLKGLKTTYEISSLLTEAGKRNLDTGFKLYEHNMKTALQSSLSLLFESNADGNSKKEMNLSLLETGLRMLDKPNENITNAMNRIQRDAQDQAEYIRLFTDKPAEQDWSFDYDNANILLDLPGLRLIDISKDGKHKIGNYTVVFAPRAGHHSNIAERTARFMRDRGLTRMAVVEQKCASEIPLYVNGKRHHENFDSQVGQYKAILEHLRDITGHPPHLVAVCQPGPLLAITLILNPDLGKTFGSAGSPMNTEGEEGLLTNFSRLMGDNYIDFLMNLFYQRVPEGKKGAGRKIYDGRLQVLGFYLLGIDQHMKNFQKAYSDIRKGDKEAYLRQKTFYDWYNYVTHFPAGFIRDTYKKIFVNNELIRGTMEIKGKTVDIKNYPGNVPIWALGGTKDDIAPPLQATGHVSLIKSIPDKDRLVLLANAGHMGLFRSKKVLESDYSKITKFILERSD